MEEKKSKSKLGYVISAIAFIAVGVLGIIYAQQAADIIEKIVGWVIGGVLIVAGIIDILVFVKNKTTNNLVIGIFAIVGGIIMLVFHREFIKVIVVVFAAYLVIEGVLKIKAAFENMKKVKTWWVFLILGVVSLALGVLLIINPATFAGAVLIKVIGVILIYAGIQNFVHAIMDKKE